MCSAAFVHDLLNRFPDINLEFRHKFSETYLAYRLQADKLKAEADEVETRHSWQLLEAELGLEAETMKPHIIVEKNKLVNPAASNETVTLLREMRAIYMARIRIFEEETLSQIKQQLEMDQINDAFVRGIHDRGDVMQNRSVDAWAHLKTNWERMLRLRLLFLLTNRDKNRDREIDALADDLDATIWETPVTMTVLS